MTDHPVLTGFTWGAALGLLAGALMLWPVSAQERCGPGFVLGRGIVNAADHELQDGSFNLSTMSAQLTVLFGRENETLRQRVREWNGRPARLVILPPEQPERLDRGDAGEGPGR